MNSASNRLRRTNPTTLYWRGMRRVQRRARSRWQAWAATDGTHEAQARALRADRLLAEAVRVTNHLARRF